MKISILEHPRILSEKRFNDIANTPLWSCLMGGYASAAFKQAGFESSLIDAAGEFWSFKKTEQNILENPPDLLCVNAVYFWEHTPTLFEFFETLRQKGFSGHLNLFGFFPTLMYKQILESFQVVDSIAVGEFEHTLVDLAQHLEAKNRNQSGQLHKNNYLSCDKTESIQNILSGYELSNIENIKGLAINNGLTVTLLHPRPPEKNPDIFAFPERGSINGTATILGSRGCYNHCSFCPVPSFYNQGPLWRGRSPENIAKEMHMLADQGIKDFYFVDPNFIGPGKQGRDRSLKLLRLIQPMKIRFGMETRHQDLDDEILDALVKAGFNSLLMGIESGSGSLLEKLNKRAETGDGANAISVCRRHGIEPEIGFLMFVPDSSLEDLQKNIHFLMENKLLDRLARTANLLCHCQIVLAGTPGYIAFEKAGRIKKSGMFGFEGEVEFADPRVKQVSELVIFACHMVLKSMSDPNSPVYWEKPENKVSAKLNGYLVNIFFKMLDMVAKDKLLNSVKVVQKKIREEIDSILSI